MESLARAPFIAHVKAKYTPEGGNADLGEIERGLTAQKSKLMAAIGNGLMVEMEQHMPGLIAGLQHLQSKRDELLKYRAELVKVLSDK